MYPSKKENNKHKKQTISRKTRSENGTNIVLK